LPQQNQIRGDRTDSDCCSDKKRTETLVVQVAFAVQGLRVLHRAAAKTEGCFAEAAESSL